MMKETYVKMQERIHPDAALIATAVEAAAKPKRRPILKYTGIAAAAACAVVVGSIPVLAANVPAFYDALYKFSPATAQFFTPVQMSCESNGIELAVEAIHYRAGENGQMIADIYLTMTDLTGDRLNIGTELSGNFVFCSADHDGASPAHYHYRNLEYDPETKTLRVLIEYTFHHKQGAPAYGEKVTFCMWELESGREKTEGYIDAVDLSEVKLENAVWEHEELRIKTYGQMGTQSAMQMTEEKAKLIRPTMDIPIEQDISFTGVGYLDGQLHVQTHVKDTSLGQQAQIFLVRPDGKKDNGWGVVSGTTDTGDEEQYIYTDNIFNISENDLRDCRLYGIFYRYNAIVKGRWNVTFILPEETE